MMKKEKNTFPTQFKDINLSSLTLKTLDKLGYILMTSIQRICIPPALKGQDILGSARTGSGKTLCFVIPTIEKLWSKGWTDLDSIGGCIICPIRELALQIFHIMKCFSSSHFLTSEILIGGKLLPKKKKPYSILVTTPSSLIKESFSVKNFGLDRLEILSFDEIDKILDMGFHRIFSFILGVIPSHKQTLLFSATLTRKIKNITRLNLKNPIFCSVQKKEVHLKNNSFPETTKHVFQYYVKISSKDKFNVLFSFLRSHKNEKIIVFFSTRKQVCFFFQILKKFSQETSFFCAYGNMNQKKRIENIICFNESSKGLMLSTDLTSRGMDFKGVDWVVQADCPHDVETYIHRIGRTGRFIEKGKTFLIVSHHESYFLELLAKNSIKLFRMKISKQQLVSIEEKIIFWIKQKPKFGLLCQSAFLNYLRFIFFQKNKKIFNISRKEIEQNAQSFGLSHFRIDQKNFLEID